MTEKGTDKGRLVQFELLRILAMLGVVLNHVYNNGLHIYEGFRVDASSLVGFLVWSVLQLMKLLVLPSVNCYILITGYFLIDRLDFRLKGIWRVWSTTWLYAVGIYLLAVLIGIMPFEGKELLRHATPLLSNSYWFVTSYLILLLLAPMLYWAFQHVSKRQYQFALVLGGIVCFQPLLGWKVMDDQQVLLFIYLFLIGGYIKRYAEKAFSMQKAVWACILVLVVMFAYTLYKNQPTTNSLFKVFAMAYHGLVLPLSIAMFLAIKNLQISGEKARKTILFLAPLSFAVYIIHTHSIVDSWLWKTASDWLSRTETVLLPLVCLAISLLVFAVCTVIEYFRQSVIHKIQILMKKKTLLMFCLFVAVVTVANAQNNDGRKHLSDPESFSMVVFGDVQNYTKKDVNQPIYELCTAWVAANVEPLNIKAVLFTGDLVQQNENIVVGKGSMNQTSRQMWEWSSHCLKRLDGKVPYIIAAGNHEYGYTRGDEAFTHYPEYYTFERNSETAKHLVAAFPNRQGQASLENAAWEFTDKNWGKILIIGSEWAPRDTVLAWAKGLCESEKYQNHTVIFLTHSLLRGKTAKYTDKEGYKIQPRNFGKEVWEKLLYPCKNIRLAICGHTGHPASDDKKETGSSYDHEVNNAYRCDKNSAGKEVHQMMFNIQYLGGAGSGSGGDGWIRFLEFMPDGKTIKASTYSVLFGISPMTKHLAHQTDPFCQFEMVIEK